MSHKPAHVLLVEDEPTLRSVLQTLLEAQGCRVTGAADAETALAMVQRAGPPDLLLTDKNLPGMNGLALGRALSSRSPPPRLVLMSGYPGLNSAREALETGFQALVVKPVPHLSDVATEVQRALNRPSPWPAALAARLARGRMLGDLGVTPPSSALVVAPPRTAATLALRLGSEATVSVHSWADAQAAWSAHAFAAVVSTELHVLIEARGLMTDAALVLVAEPSLADLLELMPLGATCVDPPAEALW